MVKIKDRNLPELAEMSFRSDASIDYLCQSMSMLLSLRQDPESSVYDSVSKIFDRQKACRLT